MKKPTALYPRVHLDAAPVGAVGQAGGVLLTAAAVSTGLARALRTALGSWHKPTVVHDPAKVVLDLAVAVALGGDALADAAIVRGEPGVYGLVASEATVSRTIAALAKDAGKVERAVAAARRAARAVAWERAGERAPNRQASAANPLVVGLDATIVVAHSEKKAAAPTFKKTGRPHQRRPGRAGRAAGYRRVPAGEEGAVPHRRRRAHPRLPGPAPRPWCAVLRRVHPPRNDARPVRPGPRVVLAGRVRRRRRHPGKVPGWSRSPTCSPAEDS